MGFNIKHEKRKDGAMPEGGLTLKQGQKFVADNLATRVLAEAAKKGKKIDSILAAKVRQAAYDGAGESMLYKVIEAATVPCGEIFTG